MKRDISKFISIGILINLCVVTILSSAAFPADEPDDVSAIETIENNIPNRPLTRGADDRLIKKETFVAPKFGPPKLRPRMGRKGECGDGICDGFEKANPRACPADCVSVIPTPATHLDSPFGALPFFSFKKSFRKSTNPPKPVDFDFGPTIDLGLKWGRAHYLNWPMVQPRKEYVDANIYDWSDSDEVLGSYPDGFNAVENIQAFPVKVGETGEHVDGFSFLTKDMEQDYIRFVQKGVERYDGDGKDDMPGLKSPIKYWQVENEPDLKTKDWEGYAHLLKITYEAIKSVCPDCRVLIGGMGGEMRGLSEFFKPALEKSGGRYFDIFDYHCYGTAMEWVKCGALVEEIRKMFPDKNFEIWLTETGTWSGSPDYPPGIPPQTDREQAESVVKFYVYPLSRGVQKIFWAWGISEGFGGPENNIFDNTGLIYDGGDPHDQGFGVRKLAYYTYKKMVEILEGSDWDNIQTVQEQGGVHVYKFVNNGKQIWVAWNDSDSEKEVVIEGVRSHEVKITESVPKYESGKDVESFAEAFKTEVKIITKNNLAVTLHKIPVFMEEVE